MGLTHREKIELIKPLRAAREAKSAAYWERRSAKWRAKEEQRIVAAVAQVTAVSGDDRAWATQIGISLD
jgi:hypothetical protein